MSVVEQKVIYQVVHVGELLEISLLLPKMTLQAYTLLLKVWKYFFTRDCGFWGIISQ